MFVKQAHPFAMWKVSPVLAQVAISIWKGVGSKAIALPTPIVSHLGIHNQQIKMTSI